MKKLWNCQTNSQKKVKNLKRYSDSEFPPGEVHID